MKIQLDLDSIRIPKKTNCYVRIRLFLYFFFSAFYALFKPKEVIMIITFGYAVKDKIALVEKVNQICPDTKKVIKNEQKI